MKLLFVCTGNAARSQFAEAIYNSSTGTHDAASAGTEAIEDKPLPNDVINVLESEEISHVELKRERLTKDLAQSADKIYLMTDHSVPDYLEAKKVTVWNIDDPRGKGLEAHKQAFSQIKEKVKRLL